MPGEGTPAVWRAVERDCACPVGRGLSKLEILIGEDWKVFKLLMPLDPIFHFWDSTGRKLFTHGQGL